MKLLLAEVSNFASYKRLQFSFDEIGLALVQGATGAGKSTLQDIACWIMYGVTAKGGSVDEIKSWQSENCTEGTLQVEISGEIITITRIRGNQNANDLFWVESGKDFGSLIRGKDLKETQQLLSKRLGVSAELYQTAAYFHEFSPTNNFFTATAKDRRAIFEKIANLEWPKQLATKSSESRKSDKKLFQERKETLSRASGSQEQLTSGLKNSLSNRDNFDLKRAKEIITLEAKFKNFNEEKETKIKDLQVQGCNFESKKAKTIDTLLLKARAKELEIKRDIFEVKEESCPTCLRPTGGYLEALETEKAQQYRNKVLESELNAIIDMVAREDKTLNPYLKQIEDAKAVVNHYGEQLEAKKLEVNPFDQQVLSLKADLKEIEIHMAVCKNQVEELSYRIDSLTQLHDLSSALRGELLKNIVNSIQLETNCLLDKFFDSEIKVKFELTSSDDLDISIQKSGNECSYTQLSKGQRGLLRLSFGVSIMKAAANEAGIHFDNIFFDEAMDGLDTNLKVKAYSLFQELNKNHDNILVIEHATEFKTMFDKQFYVSLEGDESKVTDV